MKILLILLVIAAPAMGSAQSLETFKERLACAVAAEGVVGSSKVLVTEHGDAAAAVGRVVRAGLHNRIPGYRVCIFFDNGQEARTKANVVKTLFEESYPGMRVYMVYDNPYFKVSVGNCLTAEEAIVLKGRISGSFPKAFLKKEELSFAELLE